MNYYDAGPRQNAASGICRTWMCYGIGSAMMKSLEKGKKIWRKLNRARQGTTVRRLGAELQFCYYDSGVVNGAIV